MSLGKIVGAGIILGSSLIAEDSIAEIKDWQVDTSKPNQIIVHVKDKDTLGEIGEYLDRNIGKYDDTQDLVRNLEWHTKRGDIYYTDCKNKIVNPNIIRAGKDISFKRRALEDIDPNYGKEIAEKRIQVHTESKTRTPRHKDKSLMSDISKVKDYTKDSKRIGNFVLSGGIGCSIFGEGIGEGMAIDVNAGYQLPGVSFTIGGRVNQIDESKYWDYKRSLLGLLYEAELYEEYLTATELYAQLMFGNDFFKIGGGYGVKNIKVTDMAHSYGWWEGEGGISKDYDTYSGPHAACQLMLPIYKDKDGSLHLGVGTRYGSYKGDDGLKLYETSVMINLEGKF